MSRLPGILSLVAFLAVPSAAQARSIAIDDALAAAEARNPAIAEANARVDQARGRRTTAGQRLPSRPELDVEGASDLLFARESEGRFDVTLSQELEIFGQRRFRTSIADAEIDAADLLVADERRRLRADTFAAYYDLMFAERSVVLAAEVVDTAKRLEESGKRRLDVGDLGESEWQLLVADLAAARSDLRAAEADLRVARATLNRLIGADASATTSTTGDFPALTERAGDAALTARATQERPDLAAAAREVTAAQAEIALRRRERLPNLTVSLGYGFERSVLDPGDFSPRVFDRALDEDQLFTVGISIPLPLFRSNRGEVASARGRAAEAEARRDGVAARVTEEVTASAALYDGARDRIASLEEASTAVAATLELYERAWNEKHIDLAAYLAVRDRVFKVREAELEARRDGAVAAAELEAATGGTR